MRYEGKEREVNREGDDFRREIEMGGRRREREREGEKVNHFIENEDQHISH